jgi:hypothetical protein
MHHRVRRILGSRPQVQYRDDFAERVKGDPQPQSVRPAAEPRPQLVELNVREGEIPKDAVVEGGTMCPSPCQPGRDGGVAMSEYAHGGGHIEPFGQGRQHFTNPHRCRFEPIERCVIPGAEGGATGLASQGLNSLSSPMCAITDERMEMCIDDVIVGAPPVGASKPLCINPFGRTAPAFPFAPGRHSRGRWGESCWAG